MRWTSTTTLLVALGLGLFANRALAQQESDPKLFDDLRVRLEQQDKQIQELQAQMAGLQQGAAPTTTPTAYAAPGGAPAAASPGAAPCKPYEVGDDLSIKATLKDGLFLWLETPNKDFTMHLGGWMQLDDVWFSQSPALQAKIDGRPGGPAGGPTPAGGPATGADTGGISNVAGYPLQDGFYFRRIRPFAEGTFWETGEYRLILALENNQFSTTGLDEFWVGETKIPVIGTVRVGHVKTRMGLEGDMTASSRCMTFMERSSYSEAIELNQNFVTGIWFSNNYLDQRVTWAAAVFRPDQCILHRGLLRRRPVRRAGPHHGPAHLRRRRPALAALRRLRRLAERYVEHRQRHSRVRRSSCESRPELRDDDPAGGSGSTPALPNSNKQPHWSTPACSRPTSEYIMGLEALYIRGPFSFQAEYGWNFVNNAMGVAQTTRRCPHAVSPLIRTTCSAADTSRWPTR